MYIINQIHDGNTHIDPSVEALQQTVCYDNNFMGVFKPVYKEGCEAFLQDHAGVAAPLLGKNSLSKPYTHLSLTHILQNYLYIKMCINLF